MGRKRDPARDPNKPSYSRSRTGCDRCRLRRRRCDELKPTCSECSSRGYTECKTSLVLKWQTDFEPLGKAHGRAGVWNKSRSPSVSTIHSPGSASEPDLQVETVPYGRIQTYHYLHYSLQDLRNDNEDGHSNKTVSPIVSRSSLVQDYAIASHFQLRPSRSLDLFNSDFCVDPDLLSYYLYRICPATVLNSYDQSPFASTLIPLSAASTSPILAQSLMCLSASHRSREDRRFRLVASRHAANALRILQSELVVALQGDTAAYAQSMGAILLLCQSEITRTCDDSWVVHLKGARELVRQRRRLLHASGSEGQQTSYQAVVDFAERYFAFHDVLGRTACGEEPIFGADFWSDHDHDDVADPWLGCSPKLISIVSRITELSWKYQGRSGRASGSEEVENSLDDLRDRLATLKQTSVSHCFDHYSIFESIDALAEAKRLAVEVYFYSALCGATPGSAEISSRVQQILQLVYVLLQANVMVGLTWPIFVAAVSLDPFTELEWNARDELDDEIPRYARPFILYALEMQRHSLANVDRTRATIERVWQARELRPSKETDTNGNDWFQYVAPFSHSISLA